MIVLSIAGIIGSDGQGIFSSNLWQWSYYLLQVSLVPMGRAFSAAIYDNDRIIYCRYHWFRWAGHFQQQFMTMIVLSIAGIIGSDGQGIFSSNLWQWSYYLLQVSLVPMGRAFSAAIYDNDRIIYCRYHWFRWAGHFQQQFMTMIVLSIAGIFGSDGQGIFSSNLWQWSYYLLQVSLVPMGRAFFSSKVEGEQSFLLHECLSFRQQGEVLRFRDVDAERKLDLSLLLPFEREHLLDTCPGIL